MQRPVFYERRLENEFIGPICDHPFPAHVHDVVEVVCMTKGVLEMSIGGEKRLLYPGDIAIVFPSVTHSYDVVPEDAQGLSLIFQPDAIAEFRTTFRSMIPVSPVLRGADRSPELDGVIAQLTDMAGLDPSPVRLAYLHLFLAYLFTAMPLQSAENMPSGLSSQVLQYIVEHYTEPLSLESVARALGISRIHLSHVFSQQLHINFRQHINALRINIACGMLRDPSATVTQIADACGYGNLRTFHRAFTAQCGMPPNQYRAVKFGLNAPDKDAVN